MAPFEFLPRRLGGGGPAVAPSGAKVGQEGEIGSPSATLAVLVWGLLRGRRCWTDLRGRAPGRWSARRLSLDGLALHLACRHLPFHLSVVGILFRLRCRRHAGTLDGWSCLTPWRGLTGGSRCAAGHRTRAFWLGRCCRWSRSLRRGPSRSLPGDHASRGLGPLSLCRWLDRWRRTPARLGCLQFEGRLRRCRRLLGPGAPEDRSGCRGRGLRLHIGFNRNPSRIALGLSAFSGLRRFCLDR